MGSLRKTVRTNNIIFVNIRLFPFTHLHHQLLHHPLNFAILELVFYNVRVESKENKMFFAKDSTWLISSQQKHTKRKFERKKPLKKRIPTWNRMISVMFANLLTRTQSSFWRLGRHSEFEKFYHEFFNRTNECKQESKGSYYFHFYTGWLKIGHNILFSFVIFIVIYEFQRSN